ncbi:MAG TPA: hypothetical protein PLX79_01160 [Candidatus Dojkabacteria bacterium]|nr:hypothetical protein [Candidatus Dojkabacteria bacterium]
MQDEIHNWTGGAFVHSHNRIEDELEVQKSQGDVDESVADLLYRYTDGSMTLGAISIYLENIFGKTIPLTDTQHPSYILHPEYDDLPDSAKVEFYNPQAIDATIDLLSKCMLERMRVVRRAKQLSHVLTGAEVDILSPKGRLSLTDEALSQLDYVTCSFHSSLWKATGNSDPSKAVCLDTYNHALTNPNVDTLSHPTINIPLDVKMSMTPQDWNELFQLMSEKQVAFEVNLDSTNLAFNNGRNLDRALLLNALNHGVPIVIGFDFHYPHDWGCYPSPRLVTKDKAEKLFHEHLENGSIDRLLARVLGNIYALKQLGLQPTDILNNGQGQFVNWLRKRNQL